MEVEYYERTDGTMPAKEFILSKPAKMRAKILRNLSLLEQMGSTLREPYSAYIGDGLFEIRAQIGNDITRMMYFFAGNKAILTHGFTKKTQVTPQKEIEKGRAYRTDYLRRNKGNGRDDQRYDRPAA